MQSTSDPSAITGLPEPNFATQAVGIPATPRSTVKPFCSRMPVRYFDVSNSWNPSSPKLKTMSVIRWPRSNIGCDLMSSATAAFNFATRGSTFAAADGAACAGFFDCAAIRTGTEIESAKAAKAPASQAERARTMGWTSWMADAR